MPLYKFVETRPGSEEQASVLIVSIDKTLLEEWRAVTEISVKPRRLCVDTVIRPIPGNELVRTLNLANPSRLIRPAHIYDLLLKQPRGQKLMSDGQPGLLIAKRRFGNAFVWRIHNGIPMAIRLRYYDKTRAHVGTDSMGYPRSGWVIDEVSTESGDFAQQGGRVGYYPVR
ncbi:hypothetical protein EXS56_01905 [Candidatus Kaiserbacteria bacterium]|nr:hypothetical protein [Candidatus Kaiserbacteria bacterium]